MRYDEIWIPQVTPKHPKQIMIYYDILRLVHVNLHMMGIPIIYSRDNDGPQSWPKLCFLLFGGAGHDRGHLAKPSTAPIAAQLSSGALLGRGAALLLAPPPRRGRLRPPMAAKGVGLTSEDRK